METNFDWIEKVEKGELFLTRLFALNEQMNETMYKHKRGLKIAIVASAVVLVVLFAMFAVLVANPRNSRADHDFFVILGAISCGTVLAFALVLIVVRAYYIVAPERRYKRALEAGYPGLDPNNAESAKNYVWTYTDDPRKLLDNLYYLAVHGVQTPAGCYYIADKKNNINVIPDAASVFMDVWGTYDVSLEVDAFIENPIDVPENIKHAIESMKVIGANASADVWEEVYQVLEGRYSSAETFDAQLEELYSPEVQKSLEELEARAFDCWDETVALLFDYVIQHKSEFAFNAR